jgi:hypothetical protein
MDRPQLTRRIRLAASVFFTMIVVAICVLWFRSHSRCDYVQRVNISSLFICSECGILYLSYSPHSVGAPGITRTGWKVGSEVVDPSSARLSLLIIDSRRRVAIPHWVALCVTVATGLTVVARMTAEFSLYSLILATTFVAVVLGLVHWYMR